MNYIQGQPKIIFKLSFSIKYKDNDLFTQFFENLSETFLSSPILGISSYEIESSTIDSQDDDLWKFEVLYNNLTELKQHIIKLEKFINNQELVIQSDIVYENIEDRDWVKEYQEQLKPLIIEQFFITSSGHKYKCPENLIPIYIEASRAFGTGEHETTELCINSMNKLDKNIIKNIYDIGTGSGILSLTADKIFSKANIIACDIEEVAIEISKMNNNVNNSDIYFYKNTESDLNIPEKFKNLKFDLILANILEKPLLNLAQEIKSLTNSNGYLILSGFLDYQSDKIEKYYKKLGFNLENKLKKDQWVALTLKHN